MSTITPTPPATSRIRLAFPQLYQMNVYEYERITLAGGLDEDRVELIDGYLVKKMGKNPPHSWATQEVSDLIATLLPAGWAWRQEQPVRIPDSTNRSRTSRSSGDATRTSNTGRRSPPTLRCWSRSRRRP